MALVTDTWRVEHRTPGECDTVLAKGTQVRLVQYLLLSGQRLKTASHSYCLTCLVFCRNRSMWSFEISISLHIVFYTDLLNFRALFACVCDLHFVFLLEPCFPVEVTCHFCVHTVGQVVLLPNGHSNISSPYALQNLASHKETESVPPP